MVACSLNRLNFDQLTSTSMELSVFFAGTAGSVPTARRGLPAIVVHAGGDRVLFDCGEGTQQQLLRSIGLVDLDVIFLTHLHLDHWLGRIGLLKSYDLRDRDKPLKIYGPPGLQKLFTNIRPLYGRTQYALKLAELDPYEDVAFDDYVISPFAVDHSVPAYGYTLIENDRPGQFDVEAAERLGLKPGPEFGRLQAGETVSGISPDQVIGEPRRGRRIVIAGDTTPCQATEVMAHEADLLVHEATFLEDQLPRARETSHSTARQAAEVAQTAAVKLLALTHLSSRYFPRDVLAEAKEVFENTIVLRDFDTIEIPFPERGEPRLISWNERQAAQESC
jgi:ribonuclease Z